MRAVICPFTPNRSCGPDSVAPHSPSAVDGGFPPVRCQHRLPKPGKCDCKSSPCLCSQSVVCFIRYVVSVLRYSFARIQSSTPERVHLRAKAAALLPDDAKWILDTAHSPSARVAAVERAEKIRKDIEKHMLSRRKTQVSGRALRGSQWPDTDVHTAQDTSCMHVVEDTACHLPHCALRLKEAQSASSWGKL